MLVLNRDELININGGRFAWLGFVVKKVFGPKSTAKVHPVNGLQLANGR